MTLQEPLTRVRQDTQAAFDEARALEARWRTLEREQRDLYQVRARPCLDRHPLSVSARSDIRKAS